eukprot:12399124-Karenia_brevis.AAC.1
MREICAQEGDPQIHPAVHHLRGVVESKRWSWMRETSRVNAEPVSHICLPESHSCVSSCRVLYPVQSGGADARVP